MAASVEALTVLLVWNITRVLPNVCESLSVCASVGCTFGKCVWENTHFFYSPPEKGCDQGVLEGKHRALFVG